MRRLGYSVNIEKFNAIKDSIVPTIFTKHQYNLIEKRFTNNMLTHSEKNEFSRTVSRKMKAIYKILEKETDNVFTYGNIMPNRLKLAKKYIKRFTRKFKNKHIMISGSFLHTKNYQDIDVFVITKYDKEDHKEGKFHINYLTEDVYNSLFYASLTRICISNKQLKQQTIKEIMNIDTFISLYQELHDDLDKKHTGIKATLRNFLLQAAFLSKSSIPDSIELHHKVRTILEINKPKELIKKIFVQSAVLQDTSVFTSIKEMIESYIDLMKEYPKHRKYYQDLIEAFQEVISIGGG